MFVAVSITRRLRVSLILCLICCSLGLFGSPQVSDYIINKGDTIATFNLLLESYLERLDTVEAQRLFGLAFRGGASTNCWRGYQAIYLLQNDSLFLVNIINCGDRRRKTINNAESLNKMKAIFGNAVHQNRVFIDWFSGIINYPIDNTILRWDGVFYTIHERATIVNVDGGKITGIKNVTNYEEVPNGIDRRDADKLPDIIFKHLKRARWKNKDDFDCSERYSVTIDENGKISSVKMLLTDEEIEKYYEEDEYKFCINKMTDALKSLKFDLIKDKGNPITEDVYVEIWMEDNGKIENWTY